MPTSIPHEARCLTCGYLLRDLPAPTCPECGQEFDPNDPKSYDTEPLGGKRRKWVRRGVVVAGIVVLLFAFAPRRLLRSNILFTCQVCQKKLRISRIEPKPPGWLPFRYPGVTWQTEEPATAGAMADRSGHGHKFGKVAVQTDMWGGGRASVGINRRPGTVKINGTIATPQSAKKILKQAASPTNTGLRTSTIARRVSASGE